jgi:hypothetical protein
MYFKDGGSFYHYRFFKYVQFQDKIGHEINLLDFLMTQSGVQESSVWGYRLKW